MLDLLINWGMEKQVDALMTKKISAYKELPFAQAGQCALFREDYELAGYEFVTFTVIANFAQKTYDGCRMIVSTQAGESVFESDTKEIDTDYSDSLHLGLTEFEFENPPELKSLLDSPDVRKLTFLFKKGEITFTEFSISAAR